MTLLQQLEDASLGAVAAAADGAWRGYAFTIGWDAGTGFADRNLVIPRTANVQIAPCRDVQPLPNCREWVVGMMAVGDCVFTVVDLGGWLGRDGVRDGDSVQCTYGRSGASLILITGEQFNTALLVNSRISARTFHTPLPDGDGNSDSNSDGVHDGDSNSDNTVIDGAQTWHVLNIATLMNTPEFISIGRSDAREK